jgi:hypothetical protein
MARVTYRDRLVTWLITLLIRYVATKPYRKLHNIITGLGTQEFDRRVDLMKRAGKL